VNGRETLSNIALIPTTLLLLRNGHFTSDLLRHALNAFTLTARDCKTEFLPLVHETILKALRVTSFLILLIACKPDYQQDCPVEVVRPLQTLLAMPHSYTTGSRAID